MEWIYIGLMLAFLFGIIKLFPNVLHPRCPICYGSLESSALETIGSWHRWSLVWHNFVCSECWYRWRRIEIARYPKVTRI
jgi:C4-type Zn-finger protein